MENKISDNKDNHEDGEFLLEDKSWVYWGGPEISVHFLKECEVLNIKKPDLIVSTPDTKTGRAQVLTSPPLVKYAKENGIPFIQPSNLKDPGVISELLILLSVFDFAFVTAYGKIIPNELLSSPEKGTLNMHPSMLPKYRGPSPIISAILDDDKNTGVSIMLLDEQMDHGPVLAQKEIIIDQWEKNEIMEEKFAKLGAEIFLNSIEAYLFGHLKPEDQDHESHTICKKYEKSDMEINLKNDHYLNYRKYCAFPKPFFFLDGKRHVITDANYVEGIFVVKRVVPEGKKEKAW